MKMILIFLTYIEKETYKNMAWFNLNHAIFLYNLYKFRLEWDLMIGVSSNEGYPNDVSQSSPSPDKSALRPKSKLSSTSTVLILNKSAIYKEANPCK